MGVVEEKDRLSSLAQLICDQKYTPEEKELYAKIIRDFNDLYYQMQVQTWHNTKWRGVAVLKPPTDMWIYQELIQAVKPDLIVETGTHAGGSALFMRDVMDMIGLEGTVVSIDIDLSKIHENVARRIGSDFLLLKGSSADPEILEQVKEIRGDWRKTMVILDSDHSYEHVRNELDLYAPLVSVGSALIVEDTNNHPDPLKAVKDWRWRVKNQFKMDVMCEKFMLTFNRDGFYERVA